MVSASRSPRFESGSRSLAALSAASAVVAAIVVLLPNPLADAFFAAWVAVGVGLAIVGAAAARTGRTPVAWLAALSLTALCVVGMWSIGRFFAPAAALALGAALLSQLAGPRANDRERRQSDSAASDAGPRALAGAAAVAVGAVLVYLGAFAQELFGPCARETVACAVEGVRWGALATTALGLLAVGLGGWLLWRYGYRARAAASRSRTS